eukprot:CAMPEP_0182933562 /NCGR_PEP_ID=MMETSP0105_2-20130417/34124_1 /TAXON_ID=81532 ORGANISM="Acanthoeca-like sp., Strain 10tr" /NCGR_SAMPLE_ID=MMETSP0105_2 /ASSEMBLY_ACC=CAM_ASM_000205 /LENGTH=66 /DNA_ID=CAMNT_0025072307 /DNA_START=197 /DNA_END=394 /DNA_ORIENTATION=-
MAWDGTSSYRNGLNERTLASPATGALVGESTPLSCDTLAVHTSRAQLRRRSSELAKGGTSNRVGSD